VRDPKGGKAGAYFARSEANPWQSPTVRFSRTGTPKNNEALRSFFENDRAPKGENSSAVNEYVFDP